MVCEMMIDGIVISWANNITRSMSLAKRLNYLDCHIKPYFSSPKLKIINYAINLYRTLVMIIKLKPKCVVIVCPPMFSLYIAFLARFFNKDMKIVADLHNGVLRPEWRIWPLLGYILRRYDLVLSHNDVVKESIDRFFGIKSEVLTDPLPSFPNDLPDSKFIMRDKFNILVPCSFSSDEPIQEIIEAAGRLGEDCNVIVTGRYTKYFKDRDVAGVPANLTGFITYEEYVRVLFDADLVLCLTKNDDIQMCALIESIGAGKVFLCSDNKVNRSIFSNFTSGFVDNSTISIVEQVQSVIAGQSRAEDINDFAIKYDNAWRLRVKNIWPTIGVNK